MQDLKNYSANPGLLKNKNILVTGAGDGIGKAAAICFAKHGATVILLGRSTEKLEATYDAIESNKSPKPAIIPLDLEIATDAEYQHLSQEIETTIGPLHGLLHNASLLGEIKPLEQYNTDTWNSLLQVNLTSHFLLTKALLVNMRQADNASIIFTSSSVGRKGRAYWGAYGITKFAIEGMMQTFADELENTSAIRSNSLNPGATRTSMRRQAYPGENPNALPAAEDIMGAYLFLMGDDSLSINGQQLNAQ